MIECSQFPRQLLPLLFLGLANGNIVSGFVGSKCLTVIRLRGPLALIMLMTVARRQLQAAALTPNSRCMAEL